jgi:hypothetical protein
MSETATKDFSVIGKVSLKLTVATRHRPGQIHVT